jgi:hypothetical protein
VSNVKLEVLAGLEADNKEDVQNVSTSHGYQLLEEELIYLSEYEDVEYNEDTAIVIKLDAPVFGKCSNTGQRKKQIWTKRIQNMTEYLLASLKQIFLLPDTANFGQSTWTAQQTTFQEHVLYKHLSLNFYFKDLDVGPSWDVEVEYTTRSIKNTECSSIVRPKIPTFCSATKKFVKKYTFTL